MQTDITQAINQLISGLDMSGGHLNPADIASKICDGIPDDSILDTQAWISSPTIYDELVSVNPRVNEYKDWFLDLIEHVKAQVGLESRVSDQYDDIIESDVVVPNDGSIDENT